MTSVPAGGPSTINGVLYQMLWALHRLGTLTAKSAVVDDSTGQRTDVTLVLEPFDGGDQQEIQGNRRIVEQIKSRSSPRTWSLQEVIREVLPDLYRAVDLAHPDTAYCFVTEGKRGDWKQVEDFFMSLQGRDAGNEVLENFDSTKELKFRRSNRPASDAMAESFWGCGPYTEWRLFERIASALRESSEVAQEPLTITYQKLWHLLGNFTFVGSHTFVGLQDAIDAWLLSLIDAMEERDRRRDALLLDLARRATTGNARIVAYEFCAEHNLNAIPLTNWLKIYQKAAHHLERMLHLRGFDRRDEARPHSVATAASLWTAARPILVLTGESGQGKTWLGYALLARMVAQGEVALLVDTTGRTGDVLDEVAATFWQKIVGHDNAPPFVRIRDRLRQCGPVHATRPLYLLIDRVIDHAEARRLALEPWEDWDIRVAVTCFPDVAATIQEVARDRYEIVSVPDFSTEELHTYLSEVIGDSWPTIPADIRATLRRPLLARLYRDVASSAIWHPTSEYELYKKFWDRLNKGTQADYPMDAEILQRAAYALIQNENYPWTAEQLLDSATIQRLIKVGWLRRSSQPERFEVWHNRLLNWAVSEGLVHELHHRRLYAAKTCQIIQRLHCSPGPLGSRFLGYVPIDFLWLITDPALGMDDLAVQVLEAMEDHPEQLYLHLVPTLGPRIAPALFKRLETVAEQNNFVLLDSLVKAIVSLEADQVSMRTAALLVHSSPYVQRAAMQILARKPIAGLLDRLWALHCSRHADPQQFLREHEYPTAAYEDTFSALRSCVVLNPIWLEEAIRRADPAQEPVQALAYLIASLDDGGEIWKRCKPMLYTKVSTLHERSLANNIGKYRDTEEVAWLLARVHRADDLVGPVALRALIRLDADLALQHLDRLPDWELRATRDWCFAALLAQLPDETLLHFLDRLHQHPNPWELAMVFQGYENAVDTRILEILLNRLAVLLAEEIGQPLPAGRGSRVRLPFLLLLPMARPELLECFRRQRGALLEHNLTTWLLDRGPQQGNWRQHEKCDGLGVLAKIGGPGLTTVVNQWLLAADRYGRMEAMEIAPRRPDTTTIELLRNISQREELWDNFPVEQGYAAKALAAAGELLLEQARHELATSVIWAIGRSLATTDYIEPLRALFRSDDVTRRRTACRLAGRLPSDEWLLVAVHACLEDADSSVATAAHEALALLHDGATVNALIEALRAETDNTHRWVLLDALWVVGDPGDAQQSWPTWTQRAAGDLSHSTDASLVEQIKKRRQKVLESARQKDK